MVYLQHILLDEYQHSVTSTRSTSAYQTYIRLYYGSQSVPIYTVEGAEVVYESLFFSRRLA